MYFINVCWYEYLGSLFINEVNYEILIYFICVVLIRFIICIIRIEFGKFYFDINDVIFKNWKCYVVLCFICCFGVKFGKIIV